MFETFRYSGISYYSCSDLKKKEILTLYEPIKEKYIKNLQYLNPNIEIEFHYDDYENILKCIKFLNNKYKKITMIIQDKVKLSEIISRTNLNDLCLKKIEIDQPMMITTLKDYIFYENILYKMIEPAKDLSQLEKYVYAYNIVKNFKEYKECEENEMYSRQLYRVLFNEYIVCVGFSRLLSDLLTKLNINNKTLSVMVDGEDITDEYRINHERIYVNLEDKKYKIHGYYLSDPTWDNNLNFDLYTYMLFTNFKNDCAKNFQYDDKSLIYNVKDLNDFYEKFDELKTRFNLQEKEIVEYILSLLKDLEPEFYKYIKNKYNIDNKHNITKLIDILGNHIIKKVNNEINVKKIWKAIRVIYTKSYGYKNVCVMNDEINKVINYNNIRQNNHFYKNNKQKVLKKISYDNSVFF